MTGLLYQGEVFVQPLARFSLLNMPYILNLFTVSHLQTICIQLQTICISISELASHVKTAIQAIIIIRKDVVAVKYDNYTGSPYF
jgi:hypothetical protein